VNALRLEFVPRERSGSRAHESRLVREANRHLAEDRRRLFHPCFATRLGGVSGGKETQGWRESRHEHIQRDDVLIVFGRLHSVDRALRVESDRC